MVLQYLIVFLEYLPQEYTSIFWICNFNSNLVKYKINLKKDNSNLFSKGELLNFGSSEKASGFVVDNQGWDQNTSKLRVNQITGENIEVGDIIKSQTTDANLLLSL